MGKKKGKKKEKQRKRVSAEWVYNGFDRWNHRRTHSVGIPVSDSASESATSLYGYPGLNPSVILSIKSAENNPRHHIVGTFQKNCIVGRRYGRYIPMEVFRQYIPIVSLTDVLCRYMPVSKKKFRFALSPLTINLPMFLLSRFLLLHLLLFDLSFKSIIHFQLERAYYRMYLTAF
jgi:hypothetical protein